MYAPCRFLIVGASVCCDIRYFEVRFLMDTLGCPFNGPVKWSLPCWLTLTCARRRTLAPLRGADHTEVRNRECIALWVLTRTVPKSITHMRGGHFTKLVIYPKNDAGLNHLISVYGCCASGAQTAGPADSSYAKKINTYSS